ncbi:MAG: glutamate racemase [Candidatus Komeilibacteria bacterium]
MKIGIFDSGLGGLILLKSIRQQLPDYDYVFIGDTAKMPYGNKSREEVMSAVKKCIDFLIIRECELIILACNTVSAEALRKLQDGYLADNYPNKRVLGVIVPTVEEIARDEDIKRLGIIATPRTVDSQVYIYKLAELRPDIIVYQNAATDLAFQIENDDQEKISQLVGEYLEPLIAEEIDALVLGSTHYVLAKDIIESYLPKDIKIISQDNIIPQKIKLYLDNHPEIESRLNRKGDYQLFVTKSNVIYEKLNKEWFGNGQLHEIEL